MENIIGGIISILVAVLVVRDMIKGKQVPARDINGKIIKVSSKRRR